MVHYRQARNCKHTFQTAAEQDAHPDPNPVSVRSQRDDGITLNLRAGVGHLGFLIKVALTVELGQAMVRQDAMLAWELQAQPHGFIPGTQLSCHCTALMTLHSHMALDQAHSSHDICTALLAVGFREALSMYRLVHL